MLRSVKLSLVTTICVELLLLSESSHTARVPSPAEHDAFIPHQHYSMLQQLNNSLNALIASFQTQISELQATSTHHAALISDLAQHQAGIPRPKRHVSPAEATETDVDRRKDAMGVKGGNGFHERRPGHETPTSATMHHGRSPAGYGSSGSNPVNNDGDGSGDVNEDGSGDVDGGFYHDNEHTQPHHGGKENDAHHGNDDSQAHQDGEGNPVHHGGEVVSGLSWSWW